MRTREYFDIYFNLYIFETVLYFQKEKDFVSMVVIGLALFGWFRNGTSSLVNSSKQSKTKKTTTTTTNSTAHQQIVDSIWRILIVTLATNPKENLFIVVSFSLLCSGDAGLYYYYSIFNFFIYAFRDLTVSKNCWIYCVNWLTKCNEFNLLAMNHWQFEDLKYQTIWVNSIKVGG